jgi:CheY-like chemotaxis protein
MLSQILNALPLLLIPLVIGLAIGVGLAAYLMGRRHRDPAPEAVMVPAVELVPVAPPVKDVVAPPPPVPAGMPTLAMPEHPPVPDNPPRSAERPPAADLLLVDDSAVARAKLRRLFEAAGYQVHLARDGLEALALLDKGRYALMITDLEMPNLDGVGLISACLGQPSTAAMPILAISGHENLRAKFNECQAICGIHRKPWIDEVLISHVATLVGARSARLPETADA